MTCHLVLLKLGDVTRFQIEGGMYWFFAAVFLSLVNAYWTEKTLRMSGRGVPPLSGETPLPL